MFQCNFTFVLRAFFALAASAIPLAASGECIKASSSAAGAFAGAGSYTTGDGVEISVQGADYTPHGNNARGVAETGMVASACLGGQEGFGLKNAALRLDFSGEVAVSSVSIAYCTAFPVINISAGSESPPAYHENWKRVPIPGEIADDAGNMVRVLNESRWNGEIYLDEARLTLTSEAGLETVLIGLREGVIAEICVN